MAEGTKRGTSSLSKVELSQTNTRNKIPLWRLFLLSAAAGSVDLGYAVEAAYAVPLLLASGVSLTFSTVLITISPVLGMFFQAFLGSASDQCTCRWGKRRPFIVLLAITAALGFAGAPYCFYFDKLNLHILVIVGVVICIFLLDFSIGALQLPTRAYLLDVVPLEQTQTGNFIISVSIGLNSALGYAVGVIDWSSIVGESVSVIHQTRIVFGITAGLILIEMLGTIISVKEKRPTCVLPADTSEGNEAADSPTDLEGNHTEVIEPTIENRQSNIFCCCRVFVISIIDIAKFMYYMSYHMWLVCLMFVFSLAGDFAFVYAYTTFVGIAVYDGDPNSPEDSISYQLYTQGVRMGSLGLAIASVCCSIISLCLNYITRWIRLKTLFLVVLASFVCSLCLLMYFRELYQVYLLTAFYGPFLGTSLAVPYALIPIYEEANIMFRKKWPGKPSSVEGKAVAVINAAFFFGQIISSLIIGPVVDAVGDVNYFMMIPEIFVMLTFCVGLFICIPVIKKKKKKSGDSSHDINNNNKELMELDTIFASSGTDNDGNSSSESVEVNVVDSNQDMDILLENEIVLL